MLIGLMSIWPVIPLFELSQFYFLVGVVRHQLCHHLCPYSLLQINNYFIINMMKKTDWVALSIFLVGMILAFISQVLDPKFETGFLIIIVFTIALCSTENLRKLLSRVSLGQYQTQLFHNDHSTQSSFIGGYLTITIGGAIFFYSALMLYLLFSGTTYLETEKYVNDDAIFQAQKITTVGARFQSISGPTFFNPTFSAYPNPIICSNYQAKFNSLVGSLIQTRDNSKYTCMFDLEMQTQIEKYFKTLTISSIPSYAQRIDIVLGSDSVPLLIPVKMIFECNTEEMKSMAAKFPGMGKIYEDVSTAFVENRRDLYVSVKIQTYSINQNIMSSPASNYYQYMVNSVTQSWNREKSEDVVQFSVYVLMQSFIVYEQVFTIQETITRIGVILAVFRIGIFLKFAHEKLFFRNIVKDIPTFGSEDVTTFKQGQINETNDAQGSDWNIRKVKEVFSFKTFLRLVQNVDNLQDNQNQLQLNGNGLERSIGMHDQKLEELNSLVQYDRRQAQCMKEDIENMRGDIKRLNERNRELEREVLESKRLQEGQIQLLSERLLSLETLIIKGDDQNIKVLKKFY